MLDAEVYNGTESMTFEVRIADKQADEALLEIFPDAKRQEYAEVDENHGRGHYYTIPKTLQNITSLLDGGFCFSQVATRESLRMFALDFKEKGLDKRKG